MLCVAQRRPPPAWGALAAAKRPPLVPLGFPSTLARHRHGVRVTGAQARGVHRCPRGCLLLEVTSPRVRTEAPHPGGLAHPTGVETPRKDVGLHRGPPSLVSVVEQHTPCGTRGV